LSQPLLHLRLSNVLGGVSWPSCELLYATNTSHHKQETFLSGYPLHWVLLPTENTQQNAALQYYTPQALFPFWLLKPTSEHVQSHLLPRLSWSWTVLLPSDTYRKPITSITAVLLPFVTYLLTPLVTEFCVQTGTAAVSVVTRPLAGQCRNQTWIYTRGHELFPTVM
jgi:hypothetical protein